MCQMEERLRVGGVQYYVQWTLSDFRFTLIN